MIFFIIAFLSCLILYGVLLRSPSQPQEEHEQETEYHHDWDYMHPEKYVN